MAIQYQQKTPLRLTQTDDPTFQALLAQKQRAAQDRNALQSEETNALAKNIAQTGNVFSKGIEDLGDTYVKSEEAAARRKIQEEDLALRREHNQKQGDLLALQTGELQRKAETENKVNPETGRTYGEEFNLVKGGILPPAKNPKDKKYIPQETSKGIVFVNPEDPTDIVNPGLQPKPKDAKDPSATQFAAAQYGRRLEAANKEFDELEKEGFERAGVAESVLGSSLVPNALVSDKRQRQNQAERNFVNSILRKESGAAISPTEFSSAEKQYFPRSGDSSQTLAQKKQNRQQAMAGLQAESSDAWGKVPLVPTVPAAQKSESGTAMAAPAKKAISEMSEEELDQELGGK